MWSTSWVEEVIVQVRCIVLILRWKASSVEEGAVGVDEVHHILVSFLDLPVPPGDVEDRVVRGQPSESYEHLPILVYY